MPLIRTYPGEIPLEEFPAPPRRAPAAAVVYPNAYRIGMSNLGFQFLFGALSRSGQLAVERLFTDHRRPQRPPQAVLFSISYEEDILACASILCDLGIEPLRRSRSGGPLVIAGGAGVSANPLPVSAIADAVARGEGERVIDHIIEVLSEPEAGRQRALERLASHPALFVPGVGTASHGAPARARTDTEEPFQHSCIVAEEAAFPGTFLVEISRGCPGACAFCLATVLYRPLRTIGFDRFEALVGSLPRSVGAVGLVSTAAAAHPDFAAMLDLLARKGLRAGVSSLRAQDIDAPSARALERAGVRSAALAPESGSERVRMRLGKRVPDETYLEATRLLSGAGVRRLSLYMLGGIPGEDDDDLERTVAFVKRIAASAAGARVSIHLNPLVPKPGTPLQFMAMTQTGEFARRASLLADRLRPAGVGVSTKGSRGAVRQAQLSTGDESAGEAAVRYAAGGTSWRRALIDSGADPDAVFSERGIDTVLPWDRFEQEAARRSLLERYRRACGAAQ